MHPSGGSFRWQSIETDEGIETKLFRTGGRATNLKAPGAVSNPVFQLLTQNVYCGALFRVLLVITSLRWKDGFVTHVHPEARQSVSKLRKARCSHSTPSITPRPMRAWSLVLGG